MARVSPPASTVRLNIVVPSVEDGGPDYASFKGWYPRFSSGGVITRGIVEFDEGEPERGEPSPATVKLDQPLAFIIGSNIEIYAVESSNILAHAQVVNVIQTPEDMLLVDPPMRTPRIHNVVDYNQDSDLVEMRSTKFVKPTAYMTIGPLTIGPATPTEQAYLDHYIKRSDRPFRLMFQNQQGEAAGSWTWDGPGHDPVHHDSYGNDEEAAPRPPFVTCKYFTATAPEVEKLGAEVAEDYPFDRPFPQFAKCEHPHFKSLNILACGHPVYQPDCEYYTPELIDTKRHLEVGDSVTSVTVQTARVGSGVRWAQVVETARDKRTVLHTYKGSLAMPKALGEAEKTATTKAAQLGTEVTEVMIAKPRNSFLKKLLESHAS